MWAYADGQERGLLTSGHIVCSFDDYCCFNEVVYVDITGSLWVDWDVNNLRGAFCEQNGVVQSNHGWDEVLTWCKEGG